MAPRVGGAKVKPTDRGGTRGSLRQETEQKDPHDLVRLVSAGSEASLYCRATQGKMRDCRRIAEVGLEDWQYYLVVV